MSAGKWKGSEETYPKALPHLCQLTCLPPAAVTTWPCSCPWPVSPPGHYTVPSAPSKDVFSSNSPIPYTFKSPFSRIVPSSIQTCCYAEQLKKTIHFLFWLYSIFLFRLREKPQGNRHLLLQPPVASLSLSSELTQGVIWAPLLPWLCWRPRLSYKLANSNVTSWTPAWSTYKQPLTKSVPLSSWKHFLLLVSRFPWCSFYLTVKVFFIFPNTKCWTSPGLNPWVFHFLITFLLLVNVSSLKMLSTISVLMTSKIVCPIGAENFLECFPQYYLSIWKIIASIESSNEWILLIECIWIAKEIVVRFFKRCLEKRWQKSSVLAYYTHANAITPSSSDDKESACNAGDLGLIPGSGRSPGEGNGYQFWYSGLENSMDRGVHGTTKRWTQLSD